MFLNARAHIRLLCSHEACLQTAVLFSTECLYKPPREAHSSVVAHICILAAVLARGHVMLTEATVVYGHLLASVVTRIAPLSWGAYRQLAVVCQDHGWQLWHKGSQTEQSCKDFTWHKGWHQLLHLWPYAYKAGIPNTELSCRKPVLWRAKVLKFCWCIIYSFLTFSCPT